MVYLRLYVLEQHQEQPQLMNFLPYNRPILFHTDFLNVSLSASFPRLPSEHRPRPPNTRHTQTLKHSYSHTDTQTHTNIRTHASFLSFQRPLTWIAMVTSVGPVGIATLSSPSQVTLARPSTLLGLFCVCAYVFWGFFLCV